MRFRVPYAEDIWDWMKAAAVLPVVLPLLAIAWLDDTKRRVMGPDQEWRPWFAWFPVRMPDGTLAWLEWVERRGIGELFYRDRAISKKAA